MQRGVRSTRDREPNWKLAFGSGSFLLVWLLGIASGLPLDLVLFRSAIAAGLGAALGAVVGMTLRGLVALAKEPDKGQRVDFTVNAGTDELATPTPSTRPGTSELPTTASKVVPQAADPFEPIDFKQAAKHVQGMARE